MKGKVYSRESGISRHISRDLNIPMLKRVQNRVLWARIEIKNTLNFFFRFLDPLPPHCLPHIARKVHFWVNRTSYSWSQTLNWLKKGLNFFSVFRTPYQSYWTSSRIWKSDPNISRRKHFWVKKSSYSWSEWSIWLKNTLKFFRFLDPLPTLLGK